MMQRIQMLNTGQRFVIFALFFGGGLMLMGAITLLLFSFTLNSQSRVNAVALADDVTVSQYVELPDEEAYPSTLAVAPDGTLYTASYQTGAVWEIDPDGTVRELVDTRETFGSVTGLALDADGVLYVVDRLTPNPRSAGGTLWRLDPGNAPEEFSGIVDIQGFVAPERAVVAPDGTLYVTDAGRAEIWAFTPDGEGTLFWRLPDEADRATSYLAPITFDADDNRVFTADASHDVIYAIDVATGAAEIFYQLDEDSDVDQAGFYGLAWRDGVLTVVGLDIGIAQIADGALIRLADNFRGSRDLAVLGDRVFVANMDSASLFTPGLNPQLPFALDVVDLSARQ